MNPSTSSACPEGQSPADDLMDDWLFLSSESAGPQHLDMSREDQEPEDRGKLKSKLVSAWNSVKYGLFYICYSLIRAELIVLFCFVSWKSLLTLMFQAFPWSINPNSARALLWSCWDNPTISRIKVWSWAVGPHTSWNDLFHVTMKKFQLKLCDCFRRERAFPSCLRISPVVDVQTGFPSAARQLLDHWQRLGLRPTHGPDAAGTRPAPAHDASRWQHTQAHSSWIRPQTHIKYFHRNCLISREWLIL